MTEQDQEPTPSQEVEVEKNNAKCFACQQPTTKSDICELTIHAVIGKNFKYYRQEGFNQKEYHCALFTPLGKAKIVGTYCEACKSASILEFRKSKEERIRLSKSFLKYSVLLLLSGGFSIYFIHELQKLFGQAIAFGPIILLGLGMLCLLTAAGYYSRKDGEFSMTPSFTKSDFFKQEVSKIAARVDVSKVQKETGVYAKIEEDLLMVLDLNGSCKSSCRFDGRLWYKYEFGDLPGYTPAGMPGSFFYIYQGNLCPEGSKTEEGKLLKDDENSERPICW